MSSYTNNNKQTLQSKIFFTIAVIILYRFGSFVPIPGIDAVALDDFASRSGDGILGMFNMLSGGSLLRMSIFALAIMPYIIASIIIQLLSVAYKPLEDLKKEGEHGKKKLNRLTKYLTVLLASLHAFGLTSSLVHMTTSQGPVVILAEMTFKFVGVITLVLGTVILMWLCEQITNRGIGNGTSIIIFAGIVSGMPGALINVFELTRSGSISPFILLLVLLIILSLLGLIVYVERASRKVNIQYPKRQVGNKIYGGDSSHMPFKVNISGVIPPIFASSILLFPVSIAQFYNSESEVFNYLVTNLAHGKPIYVLLYMIMIVFFSFFYSSVVFNCAETAENLKKHGAFVPGRRPGKNTADYFSYLINRLTVIGSLYLILICVIPEVFISKYVSFSIGGTSLLIVVNVIIDTYTQIQTYLYSSKYESLMKKVNLKQKRAR